MIYNNRCGATYYPLYVYIYWFFCICFACMGYISIFRFVAIVRWHFSQITSKCALVHSEAVGFLRQLSSPRRAQPASVVGGPSPRSDLCSSCSWMETLDRPVSRRPPVVPQCSWCGGRRGQGVGKEIRRQGVGKEFKRGRNQGASIQGPRKSMPDIR